jgi:hypothetical protein
VKPGVERGTATKGAIIGLWGGRTENEDEGDEEERGERYGE